MKKLTLLLLSFSLCLWLGCSSDDDSNGNGPIVQPSITAVALDNAPSMTSVNDALWDSVDVAALKLSASNIPPKDAAKAAAGVVDSLHIQAIVAGDSMLFLRLQWNDDSLHLGRDRWRCTRAHGLSFEHDVHLGEDQLFVMFQGAPTGGWDTWNWRVLTTGQAGYAEGLTYTDTGLVADSGASQVSWENRENFGRPTYFHKDEWQFTGEVMYINDTMSFNTSFYADSLNWLGKTVPGWLIDTTINQSGRESRWDIDAVYSYDADLDEYVVVLARKLKGLKGDLDMSAATRVKAKVGVLDDMKSVYTGSSDRYFTVDFWLNLP